MAESNPPASTEDAPEVPSVTFNIKASNDAKFSVSIATSATVADLKQKLSAAEYADIPPERQRLIFSGRVLKDADTIDAVKIKEGHTVHLVKGAASNARQSPAFLPSSTAPASNVPTNIAAGTGNNPLAAITGARYAGFHGLPNAASFGADGGVSDSFYKSLDWSDLCRWAPASTLKIWSGSWTTPTSFRR
jgi:ubiquilin